VSLTSHHFINPLNAELNPICCLLALLGAYHFPYPCPRWDSNPRSQQAATRLLRSWVRIPPGAWICVCCECRVLSGRGLCDELITHPEESYRLWCIVVCDLETSRIGAPYIYDISSLRVNTPLIMDGHNTWKIWWSGSQLAHEPAVDNVLRFSKERKLITNWKDDCIEKSEFLFKNTQ
jgi:hypothetical protein